MPQVMNCSNPASRLAAWLAASVALSAFMLFGTAGCQALGLAEGCSAHEHGVYECRDNHVWVCCPEDSVWEESQDCGGDVCIEEGESATCAISEDPDTRCKNVPQPASDASRGFCADNAAFHCTPGDHVERGSRCNADPQISGSQKQTCIEAGGQAFCAESELPNPACQWTSREVACGEEGLIWCTLGYATRSRACDTTCVEGADDTFCPASAERDPQCVGDSFCEGDAVVSCKDGYRMDSYSCEARCIAHDGSAECAPPVDPKCALEGESSYCDGSAVAHCQDGAVSWREYCAPAACDEASGSAACVQQKQ